MIDDPDRDDGDTHAGDLVRPGARAAAWIAETFIGRAHFVQGVFVLGIGGAILSGAWARACGSTRASSRA